MSAGDAAASTLEQRALRTSIWVSIGFGVVSAAWGLLARSEVMLLNAIFIPLYLLMTSSSLIVSRIVARGPSAAFPFGRNALAPLVVIGQSIMLFGAIGYALLEAVRVILDGGTEVAGISLIAYGVFGALSSLIMWRVLLRMTRHRPLVEAEAAGWLASVPSNAAITVGGIVVLLLHGTRFAHAAPYVDPVLVIISCLGFLVIPVDLFRRSIRDLQTARPDPHVVDRVEAVVTNVRSAEGLPEPILRVGRLGTALDIHLAFVLPPGTGDIACEDRVRRAVRAGLSELPYDVWLTVELGYDAELFGQA